MARRTKAQARAHKLARREAKARARAVRVQQAGYARIICSEPLVWQIMLGVGTHPVGAIVHAEDLSEEHWAEIAVLHPSVRDGANAMALNCWLCLRCGRLCSDPGGLGLEPGVEADDVTLDGPSILERAAAGDHDAIVDMKRHFPDIIPPDASDAYVRALASRYLRKWFS